MIYSIIIKMNFSLVFCILINLGQSQQLQLDLNKYGRTNVTINSVVEEIEVSTIKQRIAIQNYKP